MNNKEEKNKSILEIASELQKEANNNLINISRDLFNVKGKHYFELKQEVIVERAYWSGKRRYAMYITNKEGIQIEELDMKGLDLMKSNMNRLFRDFGTDIIKKLLFGTKKSDIDKLILEFKTSVSNKSLKEIAKPTGVKQISSYIKRPPQNGEIFSHLGLKCPINTKSAIFYNDLINFKNLNKKYPRFVVGDKMFYIYLKDNPYKIEVLGFNGYNDPEEIINFIEKYADKERMFESVLLNKLQGLYDDLKWGVINLNTFTNKFFTFS